MKTIARFLPGDAIIRLQCVITVVVALVFSALLGSCFFSIANFQSIGSQLPILGMLALRMGMTMLTGGIDLSIITRANTCSLVMMAIIVTHPDNPLFLVLALLVGAAVAVVIGTLDGALIAWVGASPILATLSTVTLISELNILLSNRTVISGFPTVIQYLGNATIADIPVAPLLFFLVVILLWVLLGHATLGRSLYLIGSNEQATRYSGVNTVRVQISMYVISALLGRVAVILTMAKFNSTEAGYGESYLLVIILTPVLGGINPDDGFGRIIGLVLTLIVLQMLGSGFNLLGVSSYLTVTLWGTVLILFITLQNRKVWFQEKK